MSKSIQILSMGGWKKFLKYIWLSYWMGGSVNALLVPTQIDLAFQEWCSDVASIYLHKNVHLVTTDQSVAGRGLFAKDGLKEGDIVLSIPSQVILSTNNDEEEISWKVEMTNIVYSILHDNGNNNGDDDDDVHPWKKWMELWHRDDDVHDWYQNKCENVELLAHTLHHKYSVPYNEVLTALQIRRDQYKHDSSSTTMFIKNDEEWSRLYSLVSSRAITLPLGHKHDVVGIIPMQDMINHHPFHPNLAMEYNQEWDRVEVFVTQPIIQKDNELFISYTTTNADDDSIQQIWNLIQWGIPPTSITKSPSVVNTNIEIMT